MLALLIIAIYFFGVIATIAYCRYHNINDDGDTSMRPFIAAFWPVSVVLKILSLIITKISRLIDHFVAWLKSPPRPKVKQVQIQKVQEVQPQEDTRPSIFVRMYDAIVQFDRRLKGIE